MIPLRIHRTVPEQTTVEVEGWWSTWLDLHPEFEHQTWRDPLDPADFPISSTAWELCTSGAQLAGLVRLEVLLHHGGVYVDSDVEPLRSIDPLLDVGPVWCCTEDGRHLTDAVIAAEKGHDAVRFALMRALGLMTGAYRRDDPMPNAQATGPLNLTAAWRDRHDVTVLSARHFYPIGYTEKSQLETFDVDEHPDSFGVHHWAFSWAGT